MSLTYKFVLRTHKHLKNGEHEIMLRITKFRKSSFISIKKSSTKEHWDSKNSRVKPQHPNEEDINATISNVNSRIARLKLDAKIANRDITIEDIRKQVDDSNLKEAPKFTVFEFFDDYIKRLKKQNRLGYREIFYYTKLSLWNYTEKTDFFFTQIDYTFLKKYEEYLLGRDVKKGAISVYMRTFRTLWRNAIKEKVCPEDHYPFNKINFGDYHRVETTKRAITKEQLYRIIPLEFDPKSRIFHARNYFLFSYYCSGMNFIDIAYLKKSNIVNGRINYTRRKTGGHFSVKIYPQIQNILDFYSNYSKKSDAGYVFPILFKRHETEESKRNRYIKIRNQVNEDLKTIGLEIDLEIDLTTYVARHTVFSHLYKVGTPLEKIGQIAGHSDFKTTKIYVKNFDNESIDNIIESNV